MGMGLRLPSIGSVMKKTRQRWGNDTFLKMGRSRPLFPVFSSFWTENLSSQQDLNSYCWSRRQERWPLDHHYSPRKWYFGCNFPFFHFQCSNWSSPLTKILWHRNEGLGHFDLFKISILLLGTEVIGIIRAQIFCFKVKMVSRVKAQLVTDLSLQSLKE